MDIKGRKTNKESLPNSPSIWNNNDDGNSIKNSSSNNNLIK